MKRFRILPVAMALVLMVAAVGCTTMREADRDEYYERVSSTPGRVYVDDPYRGTVVLERDPYTGRYYEVNSYGTYYGSRNRGYDPYYNGGRNNYPRNNRTYRTTRQTPQPQPQQQPPSQEEIKQKQQTKDDARKRVLGN